VTGAFWDEIGILEADTSGSRTHAKERPQKKSSGVDRIRVVADLGRVRMHPGEFPMAMAYRSSGAQASLNASQADFTTLTMEMLERRMSSDGFCYRPTSCPFSHTPPIPSEIPSLLITRPAGVHNSEAILTLKSRFPVSGTRRWVNVSG
jgi:hypothetical protein